jgi:hypothetical protein
VDHIQALAAEGGVGARDAVERTQAEGIAERAGREDEERRPLDQDDLGVGDQAPNGQAGADAPERGAQDDEPAAAGRGREIGERRSGLGADAARPGGERGSRQPEELPAAEDRAGAARNAGLSAA